MGNEYVSHAIDIFINIYIVLITINITRNIYFIDIQLCNKYISHANFL